jgi:hypothetical protein
MGFKMTLVKDSLVDVEISAPEPAEPVLGTGVEVTISELEKQFKSLETERAIPDLSSVFAIYLKNYRDAEILFDGERLDPEANIASSKTISLDPIEADGGTHPVVLEVIQWNSAPEFDLSLRGGRLPLREDCTEIPHKGLRILCLPQVGLRRPIAGARRDRPRRNGRCHGRRGRPGLRGNPGPFQGGERC